MLQSPGAERTRQDTVRWSPTLFTPVAIDPGDVDEVDFDTFLDVVHPEDHEQRGLWLAVAYREEPDGLAAPQPAPLAGPASLILAGLVAKRGTRKP